jgi:uncharacterized RDD family membrane protein YckC
LDPSRDVPNPYAAPSAPLDPPRERAPARQRLAKPAARLKAVLVDRFIALLPILLAILVFSGVLSATDQDGGGALGIAMLVVTASWLVGITGYQLYLLTTTGQTLGKRWFGVRVVRVDGQPLTFGGVVVMRAALPLLLSVIPGLGGVFSLADALFVFRDDARCIHDLMAGTKVVVAW